MWYHRIRLHKPPQRAVVPARVVEKQPKVPGVAELTGKRVLRGQRTGLVAHFPPGFVERAGDQGAGVVRGDTGAAQMVAGDPFQVAVGRATARPHGDS